MIMAPLTLLLVTCLLVLFCQHTFAQTDGGVGAPKGWYTFRLVIGLVRRTDRKASGLTAVISMS